MVKKVFIVFKTHLDIGYTDLASAVVENYLQRYIPQAIDLAYKYKGTDTPFVWTTGSWLINEGLKRGIARLEDAIKDGLIVWHGLPFTSHTELMNEKLLDYGIGISQKLDKRFGKRTIAAKMTDVPGHTRGLVPHLAKVGIHFLHIGVNQVAAMPPVPSVFRWKCGDSFVNVVYNQGGYGGDFIYGETAIVFAHTNDNLGPQSDEGLKKVYEETRAKYPDAEVVAGTLDDMARLVNSMDLPVFEGEIGDTWIHGAGTDPWKIKAYRETLRRSSLDTDSLEDNLLLVPEHTCGACVQKYYPNVDNYPLSSFESNTDDQQRIFMEKSWREQRDYVYEAAKKIGFDVASFMRVSFPDLSTWSECQSECPVSLSWQLFDNRDMARYKEQYFEADLEWGDWDNLKVGLPDYEGMILEAKLWKAYAKGEKRLYILGYEESLTKEHGLPYFVVETDGDFYSVKSFGKRASRLPQAVWLKFKNCKEDWAFEKLGCKVSPSEIVGSPLITAIDGRIFNGEKEIYSYDAPLIAPYGRKLLTYGVKTGKQDLYFNLYNNIWNTNFPLWYDDDIEYRFSVTSCTSRTI